MSDIEYTVADGVATIRLNRPQARNAFTIDMTGKWALALSVNGAAVGAGLYMALMCDMRITTRSARFAETYVRLGIAPGNGGAWFLPRLVGPAKAMELLLTGEFVGADEALRIGLVNRVVADEQLTAATDRVVRGLAEAPPLAVRTIKRTVQQSAHLDLRTALDLVSSHMAVLRCTDDAAEAFAAFTERRPGVYTGR